MTAEDRIIRLRASLALLTSASKDASRQDAGPFERHVLQVRTREAEQALRDTAAADAHAEAA